MLLSVHALTATRAVAAVPTPAAFGPIVYRPVAQRMDDPERVTFDLLNRLMLARFRAAPSSRLALQFRRC